MINLLPPQQKKELDIERKYRIFLIYGVLIIVFLIALFLTLLAVKINISEKSQGEKSLTSQQAQDYEKEVLTANKNFQNLNYFYKKTPDFIKIIEEVSSTIPPGVRLTFFSVSPSKEMGAFLVSLQGFSPTRELLFQLKKNLESGNVFKEVDFPPSNWLKSKDIEFSISFKTDAQLVRHQTHE